MSCSEATGCRRPAASWDVVRNYAFRRPTSGIHEHMRAIRAEIRATLGKRDGDAAASMRIERQHAVASIGRKATTRDPRANLKNLSHATFELRGARRRCNELETLDNAIAGDSGIGRCWPGLRCYGIDPGPI